MSIKATTTRTARAVLPKTTARISWARARRANVGMRVIDGLVGRGDVAIDIGAADGTYALRLLQLVGTAGQVHAFEPNPAFSAPLEELERGGLNVHRVALSDHTGEAVLRIPGRDSGDAEPGMGSLEAPAAKDDQDMRQVTVPVAPLPAVLGDDAAVDFIKCDVEGHENAVLSGALPLLRDALPSIYVEIEQRHQDSPISRTFTMLQELGYAAYAVFEDGLRPLSSFDVERDQLALLGDDPLTAHPPARYVNDFVFCDTEARVAPYLTSGATG